MRKFYFLILELLFGGLVFAQGGVQPIRITEMLPHVIPTNTHYGNMTDEFRIQRTMTSICASMGFIPIRWETGVCMSSSSLNPIGSFFSICAWSLFRFVMVAMIIGLLLSTSARGRLCNGMQIELLNI